LLDVCICKHVEHTIVSSMQGSYSSQVHCLWQYEVNTCSKYQGPKRHTQSLHLCCFGVDMLHINSPYRFILTKQLIR
jgi:hypothetical protein